MAGWVAKECYMKVKSPEVKNLEVKSERKLRHPKANLQYLYTAQKPWRIVMDTTEWYKDCRISCREALSFAVIDDNKYRECIVYSDK